MIITLNEGYRRILTGLRIRATATGWRLIGGRSSFESDDRESVLAAYKGELDVCLAQTALCDADGPAPGDGESVSRRNIAVIGQSARYPSTAEPPISENAPGEGNVDIESSHRPMIRLVENELRRMAALVRTEIATFDVWRGQPLSSYDDDQLGHILDYVRSRCDALEEARSATFAERPSIPLRLLL